MTKKELLERIKKLEREIERLKARPIMPYTPLRIEPPPVHPPIIDDNRTWPYFICGTSDIILSPPLLGTAKGGQGAYCAGEPMTHTETAQGRRVGDG